MLLGLAGSIPLSGLAGRPVQSDLAAWTRGFDPAVWARCPNRSELATWTRELYETCMYRKGCVQVRWDKPSDQDKRIYIIYIRDRPTQPEAIRRCPELGEVASLEPKCVYIYLYINICMHVNIYIYRYEYVNILKSLCVREEVPVCCDAVL